MSSRLKLCVVVAVSLLGLVACKPSETARSPGGDEAAASAAAAPQAKARQAVFAVPGPGHLALLDAAGEPVGRVELGGEMAPEALYHDSGSKTVYVYHEHVVHAVDLESHSARRVAKVPAAELCPGLGEELALQSVSSDIGLTAGGDVLCLRLQDGGDNMMSVRAEVRVELASGKVEHVLGVDFDGICGQPTGSAEGFCSIGRASRAGGSAVRGAGFELDENSCQLTFASGKTLPLGAGCETGFEGRSASGRFVAVQVGASEGDFFYRKVRLVDVEREAFVEGWEVSLTGESVVDWHPEHDVVLIDGVLYVLGDEPARRELHHASRMLR